MIHKDVFKLKLLHNNLKSAVMIVPNPVYVDYRVLKSARSVSRFGLYTIVFGVSKTYDYIIDEQDEFTIVLVPNPNKAQDLSGKLPIREFLIKFRELVWEFIEPLKPSIIHTHDMNTIDIGHTFLHRLQKIGFETKWIHDAHEYVRGLDELPEEIRNNALGNEQRCIHDAHHLITVSGSLAEKLQHDYSLERKPTVVLNAPYIEDYQPDSDLCIRHAVGLPAGAPLAVYSGQVKPARSVHTLVEAMRYMPDVHVVLVTNTSGAYLEEMYLTARKDGTSDRLHTVPYVAPNEVPTFLKSATVGVHGLPHYENAEVALPNKLFEYLHARLPVVVSDTREMARFVRQKSVGEVFTAGDSEELAAMIQEVLGNYDHYRRNITADNDSLLKEYSWNAQEEKLSQLYEELLGLDLPTIKKDNENKANNRALRIFHGLAGAAGQPWSISRGHREMNLAADCYQVAGNTFNYPADVSFKVASAMDNNYFELFRAVAPYYDVFHFYFRPFFLLPPGLAFPTGYDLLALRAAGKVVIMNFRGSEVRLHSKFKQFSPYNYVDQNPDNLVAKFPEATQERLLGFFSAVANRIVVPDPELQSYVPESVVVPRSIDLQNWTWSGPVNKTNPLIVHAPSRRTVKGTQYFLQAINRLKAEKVPFRFKLIENLSNEEARKIYREADIVLDQLRIGWYGVLAVEGMALGKAVVCYIREDLQHHLGQQPPLAVATPDNVYEVLRELVLNYHERAELGQRARAYVEDTHDSRKVAKMFHDVYTDPETQNHTVDLDKAMELFLQQNRKIGKIYTALKLKPRSYFQQFRTIMGQQGMSSALNRSMRFVYRKIQRNL